MGRNNENILKAKKYGYNFTIKQLNSWGLKYDKLIFGKSSYDFFVDDKCLFYNKNWGPKIKNNFKKLTSCKSKKKFLLFLFALYHLPFQRKYLLNLK